MDLINLLVRALRKAANVLAGVRRKSASGSQRDLVIGSTQYDMVASPDEPYYQKQYWHWIQQNLVKSGDYLDIGCGQGRMSLPLAQWNIDGKVRGVDFSAKAIQQAEAYAKQAGVKNIEYVCRDVLEYLRQVPDASVDGVFFLEVSFFMPEFKAVLAEAKRVLRPRGTLFASFRSQYFDALCAVKNQFLNNGKMIIEKRQGTIFNSDAVFTWQTSREIHGMMEELGFTVAELVAIGAVSGIPGDPHDFVRPSQLSEDEQKTLMNIEIGLAKSVPDGGRYMLCVAEKK